MTRRLCIFDLYPCTCRVTVILRAVTQSDASMAVLINEAHYVVRHCYELFMHLRVTLRSKKASTFFVENVIFIRTNTFAPDLYFEVNT